MYVWGANIDGQLGVGSALSVSLPVPLTSLCLQPNETVCSVSGGPRHSACVTSEGRVFAWGRVAGLDSRGPSAAGGPQEVMLPLQKGDKAVSVCCGSAHSVVVTQMGCLYTWGDNAHGQCGRPMSEAVTTSNSDEEEAAWGSPVSGIGYRDVFRGRQAQASCLLPGRVEGPLAGRRIIAAACGERLSAAVTAEGEVFVWGESRDEGASGFAGAPKRQPSHEPRQVSLPLEESEGAPGTAARAVSVACGEGHLLVLSSKGLVYAWGSNAYGQLGLGGGPRSVSSPKLVGALKGQRVVSIACGSLHSLCVTEKGSVYVWGYGRDGQCAQSSRMDVSVPLLVDINNTQKGALPAQGHLLNPEKQEARCSHVSGGDGHSLAVCGGGRLLMWGRGREGQLGRGAFFESPAASRDAPVEVTVGKGRRVTAAACGGCHTIVCTAPERE